MTIEFRCQGCSKLLQASADSGGKKATCPACQMRIRVPSPKPFSTTVIEPMMVTAPPKDAGRDRQIIGIDLGTKNSAVAIADGSTVTVISNQEGNRTTPSVVALTERGETLVGEAASRQAVTNPDRTVFSVKRFLGRRMSEVELEKNPTACKVIGDSNNFVNIEIDGNPYSPERIVAQTIRKLKEAAQCYLGHPVNTAVIAVPASFNYGQRMATMRAAEMAGLHVARLINDTSAAALAYGMSRKKEQDDWNVLVLDFGAGMFEVSVLDGGVAGLDGSAGTLVVQGISTCGSTELGGDDLDEQLVTYLAAEFKRESGIELRRIGMAMQRLRQACEEAKRDLSSLAQVDVNLPCITADASGPFHLHSTVTRARFEELIEPLIEQCRGLIQHVIKDARLSPGDIDDVVLVGGSTRVPRVRELVRGIFQKELNQTVSVDEAVAIGAAIQGSVLSGKSRDVLLMDVASHTLGIESEGGVMTSLVDRNSGIPVERRKEFSTAEDNQTRVTFKIFEGERPLAMGNLLLGILDLEGIPPAARGVPRLDVKFNIDQNGILTVSARDISTGKEAAVCIQQSTLPPNESSTSSEYSPSELRDDGEVDRSCQL